MPNVLLESVTVIIRQLTQAVMSAGKSQPINARVADPFSGQNDERKPRFSQNDGQDRESGYFYLYCRLGGGGKRERERWGVGDRR